MSFEQKMQHAENWTAIGDEVCVISREDDQSFGMQIPIALAYGDNAEAVARLMAAAPALLTALTELLAMCNRQDDFNDDGDGRMFERASAAIAKAKVHGSAS